MSSTAAEPAAHRSISTYIPFLRWIRTYNRGNWLRPDLLAGLTVAAFSVPESMAYAGLAGLSPEHGLYASMVALLFYTFFGTSRQMSVGTTSALAIMRCISIWTGLTLAPPPVCTCLRSSATSRFFCSSRSRISLRSEITSGCASV